jgi:hypothetical protein
MKKGQDMAARVALRVRIRALHDGGMKNIHIARALACSQTTVAAVLRATAADAQADALADDLGAAARALQGVPECDDRTDLVALLGALAPFTEMVSATASKRAWRRRPRSGVAAARAAHDAACDALLCARD